MRRLREWWVNRRRHCPAVFVWPDADGFGPWTGPPGRLLSCGRPLGHDGMHAVDWDDDEDAGTGVYNVSWADEIRTLGRVDHSEGGCERSGRS